MASKFMQIHTLTPYAATLLNRDDAGFAKRLPFGGVTRTRISSQCLKRHWRTFDGEGSLDELDAPKTIRSRRTFERYIVKPLVDEKLPEAAVRAVTEAVMSEVLGESAKAKEKKNQKSQDDQDDQLNTSQVTVLGLPEITYLKDMVAGLAKDLEGDAKKIGKAAADRVKKTLDKETKANLKELGMPGGLGAALFGRMVTSDILARADAAIHVAHAFTVHEQDAEDDYFSAIDDLAHEAGEQGSGHINSSELTSGLFYGYVVADLPLLVSNLTGCNRKEWTSADRALAAEIVRRLIGLIASVSPGAKLGATAPYSRAHLVMVEAGNAQPRTLANAFLEPAHAGERLMENTYRQLSGHVAQMDTMYPWNGGRCFAAIGPADLLDCAAERLRSIDEVSAWAHQRVLEA